MSVPEAPDAALLALLAALLAALEGGRLPPERSRSGSDVSRTAAAATAGPAAGVFLGAIQEPSYMISPQTGSHSTEDNAVHVSGSAVVREQFLVHGSLLAPTLRQGNRPPLRADLGSPCRQSGHENGVPLPVARWNVARAHANQSTRITRAKNVPQISHEQSRLRTRSLRRNHIKDVVILITHQSLGNLCSPEFVRKLEDPERMEPCWSPSTSSRGTAQSVYCTPHPIRYHKVCGIGVCLASSAICDQAG
jgi:hypothetical protein